MSSIADVIVTLREQLNFIEELQSKARGLDTYTKLQDKAIDLLQAIEFLERKQGGRE